MDEHYLKSITGTVLLNYAEWEDGSVTQYRWRVGEDGEAVTVSESVGNRMRDSVSGKAGSLLDFRVEVDRVLERLPAWAETLIRRVHVENLTAARAGGLVGLSESQATRLVAKIETTLGREFLRRGLYPPHEYVGS